jgi:hypothetical protein
MPDVSVLSRPKLIDVAAEVEGEMVNVKFDRNKVTLNWIAEYQAVADGIDIRKLAQLIASTIHSWDITDGGRPYPTTVENLCALPGEILWAVSEAMQNSSVPASEEGNGSENTSSSVIEDSSLTLGNPQNGPQLSTSETSSASLPIK